MLDIAKIRKDFPILDSEIDGKKLVYLDSAATSHKPLQVINRMKEFMENENGTVRRGVYSLSVKSTQAFDEARKKVQSFINAAKQEEIIFSRGTTESINIVASSLCAALKSEKGVSSAKGKKSDLYQEGPVEIVVTEMEHHANIVPWQLNASLYPEISVTKAPITDSGELELETLYSLLEKPEVKVLAITHIANSLGTINPVKEIIAKAHEQGVIVLLDGAQGITHAQVDIQDLDADFYTFSGHKLYGPTGVGVLYGKKDLLEKLPPYHGGGEMIQKVSFDDTSFADLPFKFEAGTPAIAEVIGLGAAIDYVNEIGMENIIAHETELHKYMEAELLKIEGLKIIGNASNKASLTSFVFDDVEAFDIGTIINQYGIAIRTGHHCAQPVMDRFSLSSTSRASLAFYNTKEDIDAFVAALKKTLEMFR